MIVGGGIGMAPLAPLAENLARLHTKITFLIGATTRDELLFLDRMRQGLSKIGARIIIATEDGSYGLKGLVTNPAEKTLARQGFNMIYTCGPEKMMQKLFQLAVRYEIPLQASLERYIRCGIGICGSCCLGKYRVCKDGPVFSNKQLNEVKEEFGLFKRDAYGRRTAF